MDWPLDVIGQWRLVPQEGERPICSHQSLTQVWLQKVGFCHIIQFSQLLIVTCMGDCCFAHKCGCSNGHNPRHNSLWKSHLHTTAAIRYKLAF